MAETPLDLDAISEKWLQICGACDAGIGECNHPADDHRPVMLELVREIERLRAIVGGEQHTQIEVQTAGLTYPVSDMAAAWRQYGELRAQHWVDSAQIVTRTHYGPWTEVA